MRPYLKYHNTNKRDTIIFIDQISSINYYVENIVEITMINGTKFMLTGTVDKILEDIKLVLSETITPTVPVRIIDTVTN